MAPIPGKKPATVTKLTDYLITATGDTSTGVIIFTHGKKGVGKTTFLSTASVNYRPEGNFDASDILVLVMDNDGLAAMESRGVRFPHAINMLRLWSDGFTRAQRVIEDQLGSYLSEHPEIRLLAVDSLTSFDVEANYHLYDRADPDVDHWTKYRSILAAHRSFHATLRKLGVDIIYSCHSRVQSEGEDDTARKKKEMMSLVSGGNVIPSLTGQALEVYRRDISAQFALVARRGPGKKDFERHVYTIENGGYEAASKYAHVLDPEEPFDLRAILQKMRVSKTREEKRE